MTSFHPLNSEQLSTIKQQLLNEKKNVTDQLEQNDHFGLGTSIRDASGELSTVDNHPADQGTEVFERAKDIALNERAERVNSQIDEALMKIEKGEYGQCEQCKQPIPFDRLQAIPYTSYCVEHSPSVQTTQHRPIEESVLTEFSDEGENAWEMVEEYGTASSPVVKENLEELDEDVQRTFNL